MNKTLVVAAVVVLIAAVGIAAYFYTQRPGPTATTPPPATSTTPTSTPTPTTSPSGTPTTTGTETATTTPTTTSPVTGACTEKITLTVLTRHPTDIVEAAREAFLASDVAKKYCIESIKFLQIPPGFWPVQIKSQAVDVAWGGGPTLFDELFKEGLLRPLETKLALDAASQVPDTFAGMPLKRVKDGKIYWVSAAIASFGFTINKDVAASIGFDVNKLKHWRDLAGDDLGMVIVQYGQPALGIADPLQSTSNTRMYEIILQAYGWENGWRNLTLMAANAQIYQGSSEVRDAVIAGEIMVGITIDFYGYTAERVNKACKYIIPSGETIVNGDPIAVTVSTKHPEAAEAFVAWVLTDGQKIWLDPNINRLPANPRVFDTPEGKKRPDLKQAYEKAARVEALNFNDTLALETERVMQLYFKATLIDLHDLLQTVWAKLLEKYYVEKSISEEKFMELKKRLGEPVTYTDPSTGEKVKFTLDDALRVNEVLKKNRKLEPKYMEAWRTAAQEKYQEILSELGG